MREPSDQDVKYVRWQIFCWVIGVITTVLFASIGVSMSAKSDAHEIKIKYETDIIWIKAALIEIKEKIK